MTKLIDPENRHHLIAMSAAVFLVLLPFAATLSPEKSIAAHLMGLIMAVLTAKAIWKPGFGDEFALAGAGALAVLVPIVAWEMPTGPSWIVPLVGIVVSFAGLWPRIATALRAYVES